MHVIITLECSMHVIINRNAIARDYNAECSMHVIIMRSALCT